MGVKAKGLNAERQLIHMFWKLGYAAIRIAGSGSSPYPSADIVAGKGDKKFVIECKITKKDRQYLTEDEVWQLTEFSNRFGAVPYIAVRFFRSEWFFVEIEFLKKTGKNYVISKETAEKIGKKIDNL